MELADFVNCHPIVSASGPDSPSATAVSDFTSVLRVLVSDPDFSHYEFTPAPRHLVYPFDVTVSCGNSTLSSLHVASPEALLGIPDFLASADLPPLLRSPSEEIPRSFLQFVGDRDLQLLLVRPDINADDLKILQNFRSQYAVVLSTSPQSHLHHKFTLVDFNKNFQRSSDAEGPALRRWLEQDHAQLLELEIASYIALAFFILLAVPKIFPVLRRMRRYVRKVVVPLTSLALLFMNFSRSASGGCAGGCCAGGACAGCR